MGSTVRGARTRDWQLRIRLTAAAIQGTYAIAYMVYYALGLFSADLMESYLGFFSFMRIVSWAFLAVLLTHIGLGLWKIYQRNTFRMPFWELSQILLGLSIPFFLFPHLVDTYGLHIFFGKSENYVDDVLLTYPALMWQFVAMNLAVGIHGQIGAHVVFRLRSWYPRARWILAILLSILPVVSIAGYVRTGAELHHELVSGTLAADDQPNKPTASEARFVLNVTYGIYSFFGGLYLIVFVGRAIRLRVRNQHRTASVRYADGTMVNIFPGTTILEASRIAGVPHASICGGRGRCTTCRVKVDGGMSELTPVAEREEKALLRIGASEGIRLACQAQCIGKEVNVTLLLPAGVSSPAARRETKDTVGRDVQLAVMFADLRNFTQFSENRFPYDVVFILNDYFRHVGEAIESHGGRIDKFLGDGILAYFGLDEDPRVGCRNAVDAARQIAVELAKVNQRLKSALPKALEVGIGLHFGDVILGQIGNERSGSVTIIGDTVNTASRLQSATKQTGSQMILSTNVAANAGVDLSFLKVYRIRVRGRDEPLRVYAVKNVIEELERV